MTEVEKTQNNGLSYDTKTLITILLLIFAYPVGIIMMFVWMKWPWWVKLLCLFLFILPALIILSILGVIFAAVLVGFNPAAQMAKAREFKMQSDSQLVVNAIERYYVENKKVPWGGKVDVAYKSEDMVKEKWLDTLMEKGYLIPAKFDESRKYRLESGPNMEGIKICFDSQINKGQEVCSNDKRPNLR